MEIYCTWILQWIQPKKTLVLKKLIAVVVYRTYKHKMKCWFANGTMSKKKNSPYELNVQNNVLGKVDYIRNNIYQDICDYL